MDIKQLIVLFKLRVVALLVLVSIGGLLLGAEGEPDSGVFLLLVLTGMMSAAGAGALNEYIERDVDAQMRRTRHRPLVDDDADTNPVWVVFVGLGLIGGAMFIALAAGNPMLAFFLGAGAFIYVVVYTLWLKPRTPLNIVLGGAAGSCAVLSGGAAAYHWDAPGVVLLAVLLLTWNPAHFWSLALVYRDDYLQTGMPMLPTLMPVRRASKWIFGHAGFTVMIALLLVVSPILGWVYLVPVGFASLWMLGAGVRLVQVRSRERAFRLFMVSNIYLIVVVLMLGVDALLL